ncbi:phosphatidylinositol 3,4,5-trisphosphate 5-phosphatase 2 [Phasianus colchicus]|uniref:phosphatidylinositol 3,4,5-trisphosphate 5-phosphatase 2 n=1 Tax=Phasianus colchicus TaxID=9054 RepID=UPI00129EBEF3|nr:phosphatidylinositol 3,4,5-trisphosphate 5-phosphatase 2 [Phasianus colchicus]
MAGAGGPGGSAPPWYHRDLSRAAAEELLARAGRDGGFLVRDSESVPGAYALCLLFQKHVHTYRILPDEEDFLAVQTSQGVQVRRFKTLSELISLYLQPNQGLVCTLLFPVEREKEKESTEDRDYSDGEDEKPPLPPRSSTSSFSGSSVGLSPSSPGPAAADGAAESTNGLASISHEYLKGSYALDLEAVKAGASSLPHLHRTLVTSCKRLHSEVDKVLAGLEILSKVFDQQSSPMVSKILQQTALQSGEQELESLVLKLSVLKDFLSSIEKKALKALQEMSSASPAVPAQPVSRKAKSIPVQTFEVKLDVTLGDLTKIGKSQKYTLSVDVEGGKLVVLKKQRDAQEDWNTFTYDKIRQLIKSQRVQNKLGIVFEKEKDRTQRKDFVFVSARKREAFCQLLQLMKNKHSQQDEPDMISIFIGTWNMGSVPPPKSITSWFTSKGLGKALDEVTASIPHDIYVFGTQENSVGDKEWVDFLRAVLRDFTDTEYRPVAMQSLWNIKVVVLVKPEHENRISHVSTSSVKTGIANTLGRAGQGGLLSSSFCASCVPIPSPFSCPHRVPGTSLCPHSIPVPTPCPLSPFLSPFLFPPGPIPFPSPIGGRFGAGWLQVGGRLGTGLGQVGDRLGTGGGWIGAGCGTALCAAGCTDDITTSDHSPVFGSFEVGVTSQFVSKKGLSKSSDQAYIEFESIEAIVKTASRTKFFIEFYSTCLEEFKKSSENDTQSSDNINFLKVQWSSRQLPTLKPILSEIEYLQDQHLLLTVKSLDGYESYGECVIALKSMIGSTAQQFLTYLSHRGEETGNIRGSMKVRVPAERLGTRERLYEWISVDKDEAAGGKGRAQLSSRAPQECAKSMVRKPPGADPPTSPPSKAPEEPEKDSTAPPPRLPTPHRGTSRDEAALSRSKAEPVTESPGGPLKNSFNNPAYYVLEGVPHQLLAPDPPPGKPPVPKNKAVPPERRRHPSAGPPPPCHEDTSSDEDPNPVALPPPDFPPPPLPRELEGAETTRELLGGVGCEPPPPKPHPRPSIPTFGLEISGGVSVPGGVRDDRSCSVLQMAKTLSEVEYGGGGGGRGGSGGRGRLELPPRCLHPDYSRPIAFTSHCIRESIQEDLVEEALCQAGRGAGVSESNVGEWLRGLGLERYEEGLLHNGWDDLEFLRWGGGGDKGIPVGL